MQKGARLLGCSERVNTVIYTTLQGQQTLPFIVSRGDQCSQNSVSLIIDGHKASTTST